MAATNATQSAAPKSVPARSPEPGRPHRFPPAGPSNVIIRTPSIFPSSKSQPSTSETSAHRCESGKRQE